MIKNNSFNNIAGSINKPIWTCVSIWLFATILSLLGPYNYDFGSTIGWLLLGACIITVITSYYIGHTVAKSSPKRAPESPYRLYRFYRYLSIISAFGGLILQIEFLVTGRSIIYSMENVSEIRSLGFAQQSTILTTIGFPLVCISLSILLILFRLLTTGFRPAIIYYGLNIFSIFSYLSVSIIGTNRQLFLSLFILSVCFFTLLKKRYILKTLKQLPLILKLLCVSFIFLSISYFMFIAQYRGTEEYAIHTLRRADLNYQLPFASNLSPGRESALYSLFFYPTHSIAHVSRFFDYYRTPIEFNPSVANWYIIQLARFFPIYRLPFSVDAYNARIQANINEAQWPTWFYTIFGSFGLLGGAFFLSLYGLAWGYFTSLWALSNRFLPFLASTWLSFGFIFGIMYFPNETYFHSNILLLLFCLLFKKYII
jgi:hypothetical protein